MSFVQVKLVEEVFMPTDQTEIVTTPSWIWTDIEDVLTAEWEIGGLAMPTDAIRALVAGEQKTSEET
jgi:hypothetical protein